MKTRIIKVSRQRFEKFRAELLADSAADDHLSDDLTVRYAWHKLAPAGDHLLPEELREAKAHLAGCELCRDEVEEMKQAAEFWNSHEGRQRMARMNERIHLLRQKTSLGETLARLLNKIFVPPAGSALVPSSCDGDLLEGVCDDGVTRYEMEKTANGGRIISLFRPAEVGSFAYKVIVGNFEKDLVFEKRGNELFAELYIPAESCHQLPSDARIKVIAVHDTAQN